MRTRHASMPLFAIAAMMFALSFNAIAQDAPASGTRIQNQASASFRDGTGKDYSAVSNMVTFTVARVAGLTITPDNQADVSMPPGAYADFTFRVTNTGNFTDQVRFLANGASIRATGPATVIEAFLTIPSSTDIHTNAVDVLHPLDANASVEVSVVLSINDNAVVGSAIQVFLGDATTGTNFDNVAANNSPHEVRTVSTNAVNGSREARGDISATIVSDGQLRVNLTVPPGPVVLGSNITYKVNACNDGEWHISAFYVVVPIPVGAQLTDGSFPQGTRFTTDPLNITPLPIDILRTWTTSPPGDLSTVTRIALLTQIRLEPGACSTEISFNLTVTASDASTPIYGIADVFAVDSTSNIITDQSGDNVANKGDGNANFDEPIIGAPASLTQGFQQPTRLMAPPDILIGPNGAPNATGPTDNNDDYTNLSVIPGTISNDRTTTLKTAVFTNTIQNNSSADDTFTLTIDGNNSTALSAGALIEISTDGGTNYTDYNFLFSHGLNRLPRIAAGASSNINVRVTLPAGVNILTGYDTVVEVSSPRLRKTNKTINRVYAGFVKLDKSLIRAGDNVPGAEVAYTTAYENISSTGGNGSVELTATDLIITENGNAAPNNWGTTTDHVVGSAVDTSNGTITGDADGSTLLTVTIPSLPPGASGTFTFKRRIK